MHKPYGFMAAFPIAIGIGWYFDIRGLESPEGTTDYRQG